MSNPSLFELFLIALLAIYRFTLLLVDEDGPFDVFGRFRHWAGIRYDEHSRKYAKNQFAEGLMCFFCTSVWVAIGAVIVMALAWLGGRIELAILILAPFALSGGAVFLRKWAG